LLIRSNELQSAGKYAEAAHGFEQLARIVEARGGRRGARRAANLYLEAGRARLMASQSTPGIELIKSGLGLLAASGMPRRLASAGSRVIGQLQAQGLATEAEQITAMLRGLAPDYEAAAIEPIASRPPLPTHCPDCGAPVRPDEVEWLDDVTAECGYCGSPVRGA
jgi:hypothetical protein